MDIYMPSPPDKAKYLDTTEDQDRIKENIHLWIKHCVLKWNLCPFAKAPFYSGRVHIEVYQGHNPDELMEFLLIQAYQLIEWQTQQKQSHTTLIATPSGWLDFGEYWECIGWIEACLAQLNLEGIIQVASFHPAYQFEGESGVGMYSNRSPYPLFHLLLEEEVERQITGFPEVEMIGEHNQITLEKLGLSKVIDHLKKCGWTPS
jgi:hypothetical protein